MLVPAYAQRLLEEGTGSSLDKVGAARRAHARALSIRHRALLRLQRAMHRLDGCQARRWIIDGQTEVVDTRFDECAARPQVFTTIYQARRTSSSMISTPSSAC